MPRSSDGISSADLLVRIIEGKKITKVPVTHKCTSIRIPVVNLSKIDALATVTRSNRTNIIIHLLEIGMEEVNNKVVNPDVKVRMSELQKKYLAKLLNRA